MAKHVLERPDLFLPVPCGVLSELARERHDLLWVWTQTMSPAFMHCFPNSVGHSVWQFPPSSRRVSHSAPGVVSLPETARLDCRFTSINVLALDNVDSNTAVGRRTGVRTLRLDHQLHAARFHLAGLQETRTAAGQFRSDNYIILSSGCVGLSAIRLGVSYGFIALSRS